MKIGALFGVYCFEENREKRYKEVESGGTIYYRADDTIRYIVSEDLSVGMVVKDYDITDIFTSNGLLTRDVVEIKE